MLQVTDTPFNHHRRPCPCTVLMIGRECCKWLLHMSHLVTSHCCRPPHRHTYSCYKRTQGRYSKPKQKPKAAQYDCPGEMDVAALTHSISIRTAHYGVCVWVQGNTPAAQWAVCQAWHAANWGHRYMPDEGPARCVHWWPCHHLPCSHACNVTAEC